MEEAARFTIMSWGRIGIMSGPWGDLRLGLARQTVMNGDVPYHEPMRLLTVVPEEKVEPILAGLRPLFERHSGVMFVTDVAVSRQEYFGKQ